ncbi:MAG: DUF4010 domain-containing protein [Candidatus Binataceae bacterium]|jgi:uncharacterized membrane protein (DUF4010 family)
MAPVQIDQLPALMRLGVALAIGLLIGLERGWERRDLPTAQRTAGLRTFGAIGLLGGVTAQLDGTHGGLLIAGLAIALGLVVAVGYWRESEIDRDLSLTTAVTALVTYSLGALAGSGELLAASSSAVVLATLLGFRPELHGLIRKIDREELLATFRLLLISLVMLPVLPNRGYGPWSAINPYLIWWMVVMVAAVSYVGYFSTRLMGPERGILVTGLFGGLVSSTVVALSLARRAAQGLAEPNLLAAGATIASAIMWPRIMLIVFAVNPVLGIRLAWPIAIATLVATAAALMLERRGRNEGKTPAPGGEKVKTSNPLDLGAAIRFASMLTVIMVAARAASAWAGASGLFLVAGISGLVDATPVSLSVAAMSAQMVTPAVAIAAILLACISNTVLKSAMAWVIGGAPMGLRFLASSLAMIAACGAGWLIALRLG